MNEIVIVGAGPVGLFLSIELATAGVKAVVLERLLEPSLTIKAAGVGTVGAESLERRGLGKALAEAQKANMAALIPLLKAAGAKKPGGHFSGMAVIDQALQRDPHRAMRFVPQETIEQILNARALELGVEIRRGVGVEGLKQTDDGVIVQTSAGEVLTRYLVGCDGGRSPVRKLAGFDFVGTDPTITGYQAVVTLDAPEKIPPGWARTAHGLIRATPGGRIFTVEFNGPPADRNAPVTEAEVEAAIQRVSESDVKVLTMQMQTRWTDHARQATTYRKGRVFLAGDAAHVHSPLGGQGLNLGLVDAANLGWKLAAAVRGDASLLDSYTAERHPVGAKVLENTRAQIALLRPDALTTALRSVFGELMKVPDANRLIGEMISGVGIRYDLGDDHPLVGTLVSDSPQGSTTLYELMKEGGGVLLSTEERLLPAGVCLVRIESGPSMLIRPDGCIAWTSASKQSLDGALSRWFPGKK